MEFVFMLVHHQKPCGSTIAQTAVEPAMYNPVWPGWLPGTAQGLAEANSDYSRVCGRWAASPVRARRLWRGWARTHEELSGVDPFAPWDLGVAGERSAFAVLSGLARHSNDAMSAWCSKSGPLWRRYFSTSHGRRVASGDRVVVAEGASLTALALALGKLDPTHLKKVSYPFHAVMAQARQVERCRRVLPKKSLVDPRIIAGSPTDGMDRFAEVTDTVSMLRHMVDTHEPRHQGSMRQAIDEQISAFLGQTDWCSTTSLRNRQKLKRRRNTLRPPHSRSAVEAAESSQLESRRGLSRVGVLVA